MSGHVQFETPENIQIAYQPAGLGTRFLAWFADTIILTFAVLCVMILLICAGIASEGVFRQLFQPIENLDPAQQADVPMFFLGIATLIWGLSSFLYFGLSELLWRGQTIGKRSAGIRVVKADGFSLDAGSILLRNVFRVLDHLPPLWLVPLLSKQSQRLGDMVGGTVVVSDRPPEMSNLRVKLSQRAVSESSYRFDAAVLKRSRPQDVEAVERLLERWQSLAEDQQQALLVQIVDPLAQRLQVEPPDAAQRRTFLEDFLAAEYRRQYRPLG